MNENIRFCQYLLRHARSAAKKAGVQIPRHLTAMRSDRHYYFVEADGVKGEMIEAQNSYDAKQEFIYRLVRRAEEQP